LARALKLKDYEFNAQGVELNQRYCSANIIPDTDAGPEQWQQDRELFAALNRLVQLDPANFTLALGSRSQPPLNLATWRAKGLLLEIGPDELRMTESETRDYLDRLGLQLNDSALSELHSHTEGWMVGVHLASLWLRNQAQLPSQLPEIGAGQAAVGEVAGALQRLLQ